MDRSAENGVGNRNSTKLVMLCFLNWAERMVRLTVTSLIFYMYEIIIYT